MASTTRKSALPSSNGWADSAEAWAGRKRHKVVLPSGTKAVIELPELGVLALANLVPDDLIELARQEIAHRHGVHGAYAEEMAKLGDSEEDGKLATELTQRYWQLLKWLVTEHVLVEPKLTIEQLSDESFPMQDLDWLFGVAIRRIDEDALGRRLGVARLDEFATFRDQHRCTQECEACLAALEALSTADVGSL